MRISQADFLAMQARCDKARERGVVEQPAPMGVAKESNLHSGIIAHCKSRGWIYFHGSMAHRTHRSVGEPDFIILADAGRVFFIEAKSKTGKLSPEQQGLIVWAKKLSHNVFVVRSMEEFMEIVK